MKLNFNVDPDFSEGIGRLSKILGYGIGEDISVTACQSERIGVSLHGKSATIYYREKVQFFRGLGILAEKARTLSDFDVTEDGFFKTVATMIDSSRCGVPTVKTVKSLLDYLAVMGYNMMMLYTEDVVELEGRPYFGYMRGRYTVSDLREIDDYAYGYGIEIIPCLECYGHMEKYLIWPEASGIKDTEGVMMAREEKTFEFIEQLISTVTGALRSNRIHIGMDEAWDMGRGAFLDKHGYVPPFDIFNEFMERLIAITDKYGLRPMMWSDMYFRISNKNNDLYYEEDIVIPDEVKAKIPENVELVFWHYGEKHQCDDYMLKKHNELGRNVIFAGGNWGWIGHFPEHNYMMSTSRFSLNACRTNNVKEAMLTIWCNDNAECDPFANLFGLSYFAELCYNENPSDEYIMKRFEACTDGDSELFYKMSYYHNDFERQPEHEHYSTRFLGKPLFWQDIMEGLYDTHLFKKKMSDHYEAAAALYEGKSSDEKWGYLYDYAYRAFDYLATKTLIAENLVPAYKRGDKEALRRIAEELLPALKEKTLKVHEAHRTAWLKNNKVIGWQNMDVRYGGVAARCETARMLILAYLNGEIYRIDELDEPRLYKGLSGFIHYSGVATVNKKT
ncbi:MAG: beta-N-acetylhexosaminidase [Clostridia bacterium]|nr:beta-N-acetylhexosaminidase [Clostridia bacterium]